MLFTHVVGYLKTVDKRVLYTGPGCEAQGYLKQGMLADKWLLNAFAFCIGKPLLIQSLFALTGQEREGRYCVRLYEGYRWRTVFVDDRIPCSMSNFPLFSKSSDAEESWPMILEKGVAKYLGSFGHIGACANRVDSLLNGIRMLTGGHVMRKHTQEFLWQSVKDVDHHENINNSIKIDAKEYLLSLLQEGSVVAFGRSELTSVTREYLNKRPSSGFPQGELFPVVGYEIDNGFVHFIFRDAWGTVVGANQNKTGGDSSGEEEYDPRIELDKHTGHCRTFRVVIEAIPASFDTMIICRFPDGLRDRTASLHLKQWKTSVTGQKTMGKENPAHFRLTVMGNLKEKIAALTAYEKIALKEKKSNGTSGGAKTSKMSSVVVDDSPYVHDQLVDVAFTISRYC